MVDDAKVLLVRNDVEFLLGFSVQLALNTWEPFIIELSLFNRCGPFAYIGEK